VWSLVAVLGIVGTVMSVQGLRFERRFAREARALLAASRAPAPEDVPLEALPPPVRRYLAASGAAARAPIRAARVRHGGTFAPSPGGKPLSIRGEQVLVADEPGFVWWGRIRAAPGIWIDGRDRSVGGEGNMLVRAASTVTLADARGPELDQGALLRLLGEMVWMPTALRDARYVAWAPVDEAAASARLRVGGREVEATFRFGPDGMPVPFSALRHFTSGGNSVPTPFTGTFADYRRVDGVLVPFRLAATWHLAGGDYTYARWDVEQIELDRPEAG
jgi:hypothetical protein